MRLCSSICAILLGCSTLASAADSQSVACDRECLRGFITQYLNALVAHKPADLPLANNVRFTEDTVEMKLGDSPLCGGTPRGFALTGSTSWMYGQAWRPLSPSLRNRGCL
jgi:hypothetical protein